MHPNVVVPKAGLHGRGVRALVAKVLNAPVLGVHVFLENCRPETGKRAKLTVIRNAAMFSANMFIQRRRTIELFVALITWHLDAAVDGIAVNDQSGFGLANISAFGARKVIVAASMHYLLVLPTLLVRCGAEVAEKAGKELSWRRRWVFFHDVALFSFEAFFSYFPF